MIDMKYLCNTTGWHNNCGLNCLTHFLIAKLEDGSADQLFRTDQEYIELLKTFKEYYHLDTNVTADTLKQVIRTYPAATDREAIFGPVLRKQLEKVLSTSAEELWITDASATISEYLNTPDFDEDGQPQSKVNDVSEPLYTPNRELFHDLQQDFDARMLSIADAPTSPQEREQALKRLRDNKLLTEADYTPARIDSLVRLIRETQIEKEVRESAHGPWMESGCKRYAQYIGDLHNGVMVSAEHLNLLCQRLHIGLEVYTPNSIAKANGSPGTMAITHGMQNIPDPKLQYRWYMKVHNAGVHWEYEEPNRNLNATVAHNKDYSTNLSKAKFEIRGLEDISDEVMAHMMSQIDVHGNIPQSQPAASAPSIPVTQQAPQKVSPPTSKNVSPPVSKEASPAGSKDVSPSSSKRTSPIIGMNRGSPPPSQNTSPPQVQKVSPPISPQKVSPSGSQKTSPIIGANRTSPPPSVPQSNEQRAEPLVTHKISDHVSAPAKTADAPAVNAPSISASSAQTRRPNMPSGAPRKFGTSNPPAVGAQSTVAKETRPRPFVEKEYATIYSQLESKWDWDKHNSISDNELHTQTIAKLKTKGMIKEGDGAEQWLKNNHDKTKFENMRPKL